MLITALDIEHATPIQAHEETMYGMKVSGECGRSIVLYTTSQDSRDSWLCFFKQAIQKGVYVTDLYDIDIDSPLGR